MCLVSSLHSCRPAESSVFTKAYGLRLQHSVYSLYLPQLFIFNPYLFPAARYRRINRREPRRDEVGAFTMSTNDRRSTLPLIHYYRSEKLTVGIPSRFWVVISSNPRNNVVYLSGNFYPSATSTSQDILSLSRLFLCHCASILLNIYFFIFIIKSTLPS